MILGRRRCGPIPGALPVLERWTPAGLSDPAVAALVVSDKLESVHERVSPAEYLAGFLRISRCSSTPWTFMRSATFSVSQRRGRLGGSFRPASPGPAQSGRPDPILQRLRDGPQISYERPDRRVRPRLVQRERVRVVIRRMVLHDHEMSVLRSSRSTSQVSKSRGQRPSRRTSLQQMPSAGVKTYSKSPIPSGRPTADGSLASRQSR